MDDVAVVGAAFASLTFAPLVINLYEVLLLIPVKRIPRRLWRSFPSILCTAFMIYFWTVEFPALIAISTLPALQHAPKYTREEVIYNGWTPLAVKDAQGDLIDASYIQISPMRKKWMIFFPGNLMTYASNRSREALVDIANNLETNLAAVNYGRRFDSASHKYTSAKRLVDDGRRVLEEVMQRFAVRERDVILYGYSLGGGVASSIHCERCTYVIDRSFHKLSRVASWLIFRGVSGMIVFAIAVLVAYDGMAALEPTKSLKWDPTVLYRVIAGITLVVAGRLPGVGSQIEPLVLNILLMVVPGLHAFLQFAMLLPRSQLRRTIGLVPDWVFFRNLGLFLVGVAVVCDVAGATLELAGFELHSTVVLVDKCNAGTKMVIMHSSQDKTIPPRASLATSLLELDRFKMRCLHEIRMNGVGHNTLRGDAFATIMAKLRGILKKNP